MPCFIIFGDLLEGSSWNHIKGSSTVVFSGKANAMLSASSNIALFRYIHRVTASALCAKKVDAYQKHVSLSTEQIVGKKTKLSPYVQVLESNYLV